MEKADPEWDAMRLQPYGWSVNAGPVDSMSRKITLT
jgi:hypothetical protein